MRKREPEQKEERQLLRRREEAIETRLDNDTKGARFPHTEQLDLYLPIFFYTDYPLAIPSYDMTLRGYDQA